MDVDIHTEVPEILKKLIRLIVRGFYSLEHTIVIDLLVRNPCMKEDDIIELIKFDRKQLRSIVNSLKNDKFVKMRMRIETDAEGRNTRHNYYFINYQIFVNMVKYRLDHMRRKIETEERDNTSRASFKCLNCEKSYTDLEADQLFDPFTSTFQCTYCKTEVVEDESSVATTDARTLLMKYNEQIQPVYEILRDCEDIKLAPNLLEPEPTDLKHTRPSNTAHRDMKNRSNWSGEATRNNLFGYSERTVTVSLGEVSNSQEALVKDTPLWLKESTIDKVPSFASPKHIEKSSNDTQESQDNNAPVINDDIMKTLLAFEKKSTNLRQLSTKNDESSSSDSNDDSPQKKKHDKDHADESEGDDGIPVVVIGYRTVPYTDITDTDIAAMSQDEKDNYIKIGREFYMNMYE